MGWILLDLAIPVVAKGRQLELDLLMLNLGRSQLASTRISVPGRASLTESSQKLQFDHLRSRNTIPEHRSQFHLPKPQLFLQHIPKVCRLPIEGPYSAKAVRAVHACSPDQRMAGWVARIWLMHPITIGDAANKHCKALSGGWAPPSSHQNKLKRWAQVGWRCLWPTARLGFISGAPMRFGSVLAGWQLSECPQLSAICIRTVIFWWA